MKQENKSIGRRLVRALKWVIPLLIVVGLIVLAFLPRAVEVDLAEITRGPMSVTVDEDGMTRVRERYIITAPVAGRLLRIELDPGDAVGKGDIIATLDPGDPTLLDPRIRAEAEARVKAAEASLARARSQLESARAEADMFEKAFNRSRTLFEKGNLREAAFEEAETQHLSGQLMAAAAESAVNIATFELEQAKATLLFNSGDESATASGDWHFRIRSPIDGSVLRLFRDSSSVVASGEQLLEIGDPSDLELRIDVLSQDAVSIRPGQSVVLEHWGGESPLHARVRRVEPSGYTKVSALGVDEQRVDVIADLEAPPDQGETLGDGFRVEARIIIWEGEDILLLPSGALFRSGDDWAVYRKAGGRAELVAIEIGHNNGNEVEILSGLSEGDEVVLHPSNHIKDGVLIKPAS